MGPAGVVKLVETAITIDPIKGNAEKQQPRAEQKRAIRGRGLFRATGLARLINCSEFCWIFSIRFIDLGRLTRTTCNAPLA
jgi:hypothetical protein